MRRRQTRPYRMVAGALRERLEAGEWLPGEVLPSSAGLADEYGVSRATAARAVRVLAEETGRIVIEPSWGAFVKAE